MNTTAGNVVFFSGASPCPKGNGEIEGKGSAHEQHINCKLTHIRYSSALNFSSSLFMLQALLKISTIKVKHAPCYTTHKPRSAPPMWMCIKVLRKTMPKPNGTMAQTIKLPIMRRRFALQ